MLQYTGPVAEVDEADDSISDDEEPREEQVPSLATAEPGKKSATPPQTAEPPKEEAKPEPTEEKKEPSDVQKEEEQKPEGS